jgi:hypothetical protein
MQEMTQSYSSNNDIEAPVLEVESGVTSIYLDPEDFGSLTGYNLAGTDGTVAPASDEFQLGFSINEESNFTFTTANGLTPLGGSILHDGTITLNAADGDTTVGGFEVAFDPSRVSEKTSGFYVKSGFFTTDTIVNPGIVLFDLTTPEIVDITDSTLSVDEADLLISAEFSSFLQNQELAYTDVTGADVGDTRIDALIGIEEPVLEVESGVTSIYLDPDEFGSLAGYSLAGTDDTVAPATDEFQLGFSILEESDFTFTTDNGLTPLGGSILHDGTITLNSTAGDITVGGFEVAFDPSRVSEKTSGFYVKSGFFTTDTIVNPGIVLFDLTAPEIVDITDSTLTLDEADLLISAEFSSFLQNQGLAYTDVTGADVGDTRVDAIIDSAEYDCNFG